MLLNICAFCQNVHRECRTVKPRDTARCWQCCVLKNTETGKFISEKNPSVKKGKGNGRPRTGHERPEVEQTYSSTLSLISGLDIGGWSAPRPGRFTPRKGTRYPLYRRLGGTKGRVRKISPPSGFDPQTVQPVASRYTD